MNMAQEITNFARFYALFNKIPCSGDREEFKKEMVSNATLGRTDSLREVTRREYQDLCEALEKVCPMSAEAKAREAAREELKRQRSSALHQMQKMGVDTTDWNRINALCKDLRIAGKPFAQMTAEELAAMTVKLRTIERKGGFRNLDDIEPKATIININNH